MAITNTIEEFAQIKTRKELEDRIDLLRPSASAFLLKTLIVAGHVSEHTMNLALDLAATVKED